MRPMRTVGCVSDRDLKAFALGELPTRLADAVASHLELCPDCAQRASSWDSLTDTVVRALRQPSAEGAASTLEVPAADTGEPTTPTDSPQAMSSPEGYTLLAELGRGAT